jgi:hypothetical protein
VSFKACPSYYGGFGQLNKSLTDNQKLYQQRIKEVEEREQKETKERDARIADLEDQVKSLIAANFSVLTGGCMTMLLMKQCWSKIQSVFDTRTVPTAKDFYLF